MVLCKMRVIQINVTIIFSKRISGTIVWITTKTDFRHLTDVFVKFDFISS